MHTIHVYSLHHRRYAVEPSLICMPSRFPLVVVRVGEVSEVSEGATLELVA